MKLSKLLSLRVVSQLIIVHIFYIQITIPQSICIDNNYPCQSDDNSWWYSTDDIIPTDSTSYGHLKLRDSMYMEFDIINNEGIANQWENIFRIGFNGTQSGACAGKGSRYPGLFMGPDDDFFHFAVSESSNCYAGGVWQQEPPSGFGTYEMVRGRSYSAIINYNESRVIVQIKDNTLNTPWETYINVARGGTNPSYFNRYVHVFMGTDQYAQHPIDPICNVTLSNVIIVSYWQNSSFTLPPTYAPTAAPTDIPTDQPSISPTPATSHPSTVKSFYMIFFRIVVEYDHNNYCE